MADRLWTREEVMLTINLYCKLPYAKLRQTTPEIKELARLLGRTPSAISMRCCNYVQFDPIESKRVKGFIRVAKLDKAIFTEINGDWENFAVNCEYLLEQYRKRYGIVNTNNEDSLMAHTLWEKEVELPIGSAKKQLVNTRIGQRFFREVVLSAYNHQCCITGLHHNALLIASHIKPWKNSDPKTERTNPRNGLCLSALYDKAFDAGLMTIDEQYRIVFDKQIYNSAEDKIVKHLFKRYEGKFINLPERFVPDQLFLAYHREYVFHG
jgi:hypothetical protein